MPRREISPCLSSKEVGICVEPDGTKNIKFDYPNYSRHSPKSCIHENSPQKHVNSFSLGSHPLKVSTFYLNCQMTNLKAIYLISGHLCPDMRFTLLKELIDQT